jgi:hypothetical protein
MESDVASTAVAQEKSFVEQTVDEAMQFKDILSGML